MAAYVLVDIEVTDQETYDDYRRQVPPLVKNTVANTWCEEGIWKPLREIGNPND